MSASPTASAGPRIVVSTLFYYKEDLAEEFLLTLLPQLILAAEMVHGSIRLVVSLNYPFTATFWERIERETRKAIRPGVSLELIRRGHNIGFGAAHRWAFEHYDSDVFVVMNNDLFCERPDWLATMAGLLGPEGTADLVGAEENLTDLRASDGCGVPRAAGSVGDFVDGSLLGFRSSTAQRLGTFAPDFHYFYFEDADLVLRYRQAGARIEPIPVPHRHLRWSGSQQLPRYVVENLLDSNRAAFFRRWSRYLETRTLRSRVLADLAALDPDGCIETLPALLALTRDHPGVPLHIRLPDGASTRLFQHEAWSITTAPEGEFDRSWIASPKSNGSLPAVLGHLRDVGASEIPPETATHFYRTAGLSATVSRDEKRALICTMPPSPRLHGVSPAAEFYRPAAELLRTRGYHITWATDSASDIEADDARRPIVDPMDWLQAILTSTIVIAPAGLAATLAQLTDTAVFVIGGSILPQRILWDWRRGDALLAPDLACVGCQQAWGAPDRAYCLRRDEACIAPGLGEAFAAALARFLDGSRSALATAIGAEQRLALFERKSSPDLDLSRWPADQV